MIWRPPLSKLKLRPGSLLRLKEVSERLARDIADDISTRCFQFDRLRNIPWSSCHLLPIFPSHISFGPPLVPMSTSTLIRRHIPWTALGYDGAGRLNPGTISTGVPGDMALLPLAEVELAEGAVCELILLYNFPAHQGGRDSGNVTRSKYKSHQSRSTTLLRT